MKSTTLVEFDSHSVYIGGKIERITRRQNIGTIPILRYPHRADSVIGKQVKGGYIYFRHQGIKYRGYFKIVGQGYAITKMTEIVAKEIKTRAKQALKTRAKS